MTDLPTAAHSRATAAERAGTDELRRAIATTRRRLLDVLYARAQALSGVTGWVGPQRERFDAESHALLAAGRDLDDALAGLLYALDDELDALRGARPSTLSDAAITVPMHDGQPDDGDAGDERRAADVTAALAQHPAGLVGRRVTGPVQHAAGRSRQRVIGDAPVIPIRPDLLPT